MIINAVGNDFFESNKDILVLILSNGEIIYAPNGIIKTFCQIKVRNFPFDYQTCFINLTR